MENHTYEEKKKRLLDRIGELCQEDICLAFSGGVDSSLLLKLLRNQAKERGSRVYAVTFATKLHPSCDIENARKVAGELGGEHAVLEIDELEQKEIRNNPPNRCYLCKKHLFSRLKDFGREKGAALCLDGTNGDDRKEYRPGLQALKELSVISPLAETGFTKKEVRRLAEEYGISCAERPSAPCMATRLPYGAEIDYELLGRIASGEELLRSFLGGNIRLRVHGEIVRIEIDKGRFSEFLAKGDEITAALKKAGFSYITLDMEGFRSGSMDIHMNYPEAL
ncbi:ATP-dependent sacrificial sulfur transferase LarE [Lachnospiraceae bacterium 62-35]